VRLAPAGIAGAFRAACLAELAALKPGNVHVFSDGHRMTVADFERSAEAAAPAIAAPGARVGARILAAVEATREAVGQNTNLGIVLLAAPLAAAAEREGGLRAALLAVLAGLDVEDADLAYRAIRLAGPAGLGRAAEHDVGAAPRVTLLEAMRAAAPRDRIARAYADGYEDVFGLGLPTLRAAREAGVGPPWDATALHLALLAAFPDTHVARKFGGRAAEALRDEAAALLAALGPYPGERDAARLLAFDASLKARGLNPGITADLTVAALFADRLAPRILRPRRDDD